jgi:hypothetical protein
MPFPLHSPKMAFTWFRRLPLGFEEPACLCEVKTFVPRGPAPVLLLPLSALTLCVAAWRANPTDEA